MCATAHAFATPVAVKIIAYMTGFTAQGVFALLDDISRAVPARVELFENVIYALPTRHNGEKCGRARSLTGLFTGICWYTKYDHVFSFILQDSGRDTIPHWFYRKYTTEAERADGYWSSRVADANDDDQDDADDGVQIASLADVMATVTLDNVTNV